MPRPFHLAIPVLDLEETRSFYRDILQCKEGRSSDHWVDLDLFGHQLVLHLTDHKEQAAENPVDGHEVPVPHFGVVLEMDTWKRFATHLKDQGVSFIIEPYIRFEGQPGEQATLFFLDPSGNALEFKAFQNDDQLFAT